MEESSSLTLSLLELNRMRSRLNLSMSCIRILRDGILGLCCFLLWAWLSPEAWGQQLSIFLLSFIVFIGLDGRSNLPLSSPGDWLLALEMAYPKAKQSAFNLNKQAFLDPDWQHLLALELAKHRQESRQLLIVKASSLLLPGLLLLFLIQTAGYSWTGAMHSLQKVALSLSYGAKLRVIEGAVETNGGLLKLTSKTIELTVLEQNLIEVLVTAAPDAVPILQLQNQANKPLQTFRLTKTPGPEGMESIGNYSVTFALTEDAKLFLNTVSDHQAVALIHVKKLPIPQVELSSQAVPDAAWPDDKPLPLHIEVKAEHPLQSLQLLIKSGDRVHKELVTEVLAKDKQDLTIDYRLALETFLEQDLQELEIVAEATDRAFPVALVGRSKPLIIKVASAYGRYKQTLQTLREAKSELDRAIEGQDAFAPKNLAELGKKASQQAEDSPFFDGLDRHQIKQFDESFAKIAKSIDMELVAQASEDLNRFLFEHESLDDRERDRDFFVAARSLSRLLEQKTEDRPISIGKIADHLATFLAERQQRWQQRVQYLGANHRPEEWESVRKKPFEQALKSLVQDDRSQPPKSAEALQKLSQTVESYRQWIEALEAKEDSARAEQEKQRQQGLANAQNQLKELQRRQAQVSIKLDKAASRSAEDIEQSWASVRMDQNSNIKGTREMEGQLRSLSPSAGERIKAALGAMETTVESGNQQHYAEAESTSDLAGRLLQQAESAARQSQRDSGKRGRRRRVTSDQYYGNQVAGGDVDMRRDYKVNRRYREDVLEDVRQFKKRESTEDSGILLEDYLRKVIR